MIGGSFFFEGSDPDRVRLTVQTTYLAIAVAVLGLAALLTRARLSEPLARPPALLQARAHEASPGQAGLARPHFIFGVVTLILYVGAQAGSGAFFLNLVTETWPGLTSRDGAFLFSIAGAGCVVGRFLTTGLLLRFRAGAVLAVYGVANVLLCLLVVQGIAKVSAFALMTVFFFMSTMFPTIFTLGLAGLGPLTKRGASVMMLAVGGGVVLPYPMGLIAEAQWTPAAFLLPAACFAAVAIYGAEAARAAHPN